MKEKNYDIEIFNFKYILISTLTLNFYILFSLEVNAFSMILNLIISFGILNYYNKNKINEEKQVGILQFISFFFILTYVLYRSYWLHTGDNFIFCLLPLLLLALLLIYSNFSNITKNFQPIFISLLFPLSKILFIPLSIVIVPFSTFFTWIILNTLGFTSVMDSQVIFYNNTAINVTFSCSGSGQIIFSIFSMIILNFSFPLKNIRLLFLQLFLSFLFTFAANIIRLFLLTLYAYTVNFDGFSMFNYLHGGSGGLAFGFFSMLLCCETYKRIYYKNYDFE